MSFVRRNEENRQTASLKIYSLFQIKPWATGQTCSFLSQSCWVLVHGEFILILYINFGFWEKKVYFNCKYYLNFTFNPWWNNVRNHRFWLKRLHYCGSFSRQVVLIWYFDGILQEQIMFCQNTFTYSKIHFYPSAV